ncbi:exopolyphosphatase / guanosine-5'-triphosphate,3'-diphosphate pyrophosphatase [Saccharopolyspora kobensis]|uniref:Exopolyphosphatase / guanosine-5'-triphosphate,3'-diphosphate pyrophosphatase n=1 Tax=Saccharopolyspora kobensis TaxID=146035 RepID=A0A1H6AGI4_9PSEU|nr:exopolyphosphatase / guanosine-5'-triphosphate,3'-diphosphate pyrophosphatase [Saccharopolyspora kobensis]SFE56960.1 exopolyphosphatase / guanosine-5'-triphosphate,3'-diphosphate pyrophosphatase [Saccharopolyspora kobensis]
MQATGRALAAARQSSVEQLFAFVTSAIRDAANRHQVLDRLERETGIRPQFLSGQDEARLTYLAVRSRYGWSAGRLLVVDIGGGSMEIMLGRDAEPELAVSLPLGAGLLTREFLPDDPPTGEQISALRKHIRDTLREVVDRIRWEGEPARAIGTSKTFKQLARLAGAPPQRKGPFVRRALSAKDFGDWVPRLAAKCAAKRSKLRGVSRARARQVLAGALVVKATMKALNTTSVEICPWALREGIMLHYLQTKLDHIRELPLQPVRPGEIGGSPREEPSRSS